MAMRVLQAIHEKTHWGTQALVDQFAIKYMCIGVYNLAKQVTQQCLTCQRINKQQLRERPMGGRELAQRPFSHIQIDFTELPKVGRYKYLLVLVDHLTHYVEAYPMARATSNTVVKVLLEQIIPQYGLIECLDSDRGPHFTSKIAKDVLTALGTQWKYHTLWHPQSSGRVERMNGEIKKQLTKLMLETKMSWVKCLPLALLNIRTQPRTDVGISPFEMLFGMPYDMEAPTDHPYLKDSHIKFYITQIMSRRQELRKKGVLAQRPPLDITIHKIKPGDQVLIKSWKEDSLTPCGEGPFLVLLTTETAVRTAEKGWTHASRVKGPVATNNQWRVTSQPGNLKVTLKKN
ncbi:protein NYNRIN-like [Vidua chalybeata]|uniref:protein NYNRIN-like n=1 Tax=Vidua chalybeata TaxID=81927 RepID=UPI0023A7F127|nr:protein NYNRIN-like [Vidua chalybeata]